MMPRPPISQRRKKMAINQRGKKVVTKMPKERRRARREAREEDLAPLKAPTPRAKRRRAEKEEREVDLTPKKALIPRVSAKREVEMTKKTDHQRKRKSSPKKAKREARSQRRLLN